METKHFMNKTNELVKEPLFYVLLAAGALTFGYGLFKPETLQKQYNKIVEEEIGKNPTKEDSVYFYFNHELINHITLDENCKNVSVDCYTLSPIPDSAKKRIVEENNLERKFK